LKRETRASADIFFSLDKSIDAKFFASHWDVERILALQQCH